MDKYQKNIIYNNEQYNLEEKRVIKQWLDTKYSAINGKFGQERPTKVLSHKK